MATDKNQNTGNLGEEELKAPAMARDLYPPEDDREPKSKTLNEDEESWENAQKATETNSGTTHNNWDANEQLKRSAAIYDDEEKKEHGRYNDEEEDKYGQENDRRNREELE